MRSCGPFLLAVARPLLPAHPVLGDAERRRVECDLADFLGAEIDAMPLHLRLGFRAALRVFAAGSWLRHGRGFAALPPEAQARRVRSWDESRIGPLRDFVRLVKSCALFFYLDHPVVSARLAAPAEAQSARAG